MTYTHSILDWPQSSPVPKFQNRTEFLWFDPVWSGKKLDQTGLHYKSFSLVPVPQFGLASLVVGVITISHIFNIYMSGEM